MGQAADVVQVRMAEQDVPDFGLFLLVEHMAHRSRVQQDGFIQQKTIQKAPGCFSPVRAQDSKFHATLQKNGQSRKCAYLKTL
jgi:hypothetical protein